MRLTTRIALGLAALVVLVIVLAMHHRRVARDLAEDQRRLSEGHLDTLVRADELSRRVARLAELARKLAVLRDPAYAAALDEERRAFAGELADLAPDTPEAGEGEALAVVRESWATYAADAAELEEAAVERGEGQALRAHVASSLEPVADALEELRSAAHAGVSLRVEQSTKRAGSAERAAWAAGLAAIALALAVAAIVVLPMRSSLARLGRGTEELARGRFDHRVEPGGGTELATLAASFNAMAQRLGELDRLKRDFVSAVSHDLKAPLASVEETLSLLLEGSPGPLTDRQRRLLELSRVSGGRLRRMIGDLLDLARLDAGVWERPPAPTDLGELVRAGGEALAERAAESGVEIVWDLPAALLPVEVDAASLRRLVDNLWDNAFKHTPAGGSVGLTMRWLEGVRELPERVRRLGPPPATGGVLVEVWDTGPGVEEGDRERIFDRFQTGSRARGAGTGMGLAIARAIARAHGGELWFEPRVPAGSRFLFFLWPRPEVAS